MKYLHDEDSQTVYAVGEVLVHARRESKTKSRPNPRVIGQSVTRETAVMSARNWIDPETNLWHEPVFRPEHQNFDSRDNEERAETLFRMWHLEPGRGKEITQAEYEMLRARYETMARGNKPPKNE